MGNTGGRRPLARASPIDRKRTPIRLAVNKGRLFRKSTVPKQVMGKTDYLKHAEIDTPSSAIALYRSK